ncbi:HD domain-containing protein [Eubacterium sp.]|uniref:HD domain-containing protein n=1 Tax=Eubacterium sp. TaxID=142586 RepID=UPI0015B35A1D|nr:HD domain-containing protein [Eubacterium sp.]
MKKVDFDKIEQFMLRYCGDSCHDREHIYRVLYNALDIAKCENNVNFDILITSCLLHDIGRPAQLNDGSIDHAEYGSEIAYNWLIENNFSVDFSLKVAECIRCHRYRGNNIPKTIEAKILYDSDKIDAAGLIGISRTLMYKGAINEPIYYVVNGKVQNGFDKTKESFFTEYIHKLSKVYDKMLTAKGKEKAYKLKCEAEEFYNKLYGYLDKLYISGNATLDKYLKEI